MYCTVIREGRLDGMAESTSLASRMQLDRFQRSIHAGHFHPFAFFSPSSSFSFVFISDSSRGLSIWRGILHLIRISLSVCSEYNPWTRVVFESEEGRSIEQLIRWIGSLEEEPTGFFSRLYSRQGKRLLPFDGSSQRTMEQVSDVFNFAGWAFPLVSATQRDQNVSLGDAYLYEKRAPLGGHQGKHGGWLLLEWEREGKKFLKLSSFYDRSGSRSCTWRCER